MNDFEGLLATDYGFKPQGKSVPMATSSKGPSNPSPANSVNFDLGSFGNSRSTKHSSSFGGSFPNDGDSIFAPIGSRKNQNLGDLDDFLGGSGKSRNKLESRQGDTDFNFDSIFRGSSNTGVPSMNSPNYDKPVYDDDIFDGVPGLKSSSKVKYDNVFVSSSSPSKRNAAFDDLLVGFGKAESVSNTKSSRKVEKDEKGIPAFDDFLRGFGGTSSPGDRTTSETKWSSEPTPAKTSFKPVEDPFMVSGNFSNPLDDISKVGSSAKISSTSAANNRVFEDVDPFAGLGKSVPAFSSEANNAKKDSSPSRVDMSSSGSQSSTNKPTTEKTSVRSPERFKPKKSVEYDSQTDQTLFDIPTSSSDSQKFVSRSASPPFDATTGSKDNNFHGNIPPMFENNLDFSDDVWLTVSEIPLFTQPTSAPPPSRPPPPIPGQVPSSSTSMYSKKKTNEYSFPNYTGNFQASKFTPASLRASDVSPRDEFEEFSMGDSRSYVDGLANGLSNEEFEMNSAAAAMKETMDRAEAKFKHAKEVREREGTKPARSKEAGQLDEDKKLAKDERARRQERIDRERLQREKEKEEREKQRMERERERAREGEEREEQRMERERERAREVEEREKQRMERERERARDIEKEREEKDREQRRLEKERGLEVEREKARQLVERATREARERAAADARLRAERAAVDKIHAEARQRAERAAVQRAQTEARERAATEARERAEKAAAEARERANMEAKEREARESVSARTEARARAERAAVERAAAEARERAATSAATAAASASARTNQQRNENDLDSFFDMGNRASSAPRHRTAPSENFFDPQPQSQYGTETAKTASVSTSSMRKASSTTNIVDDLSSIFGAAPSSGDFQDVDGESEERRRARLERHQRTQERAAKALAEKNQRDLQILREQAERHRIAETLDIEIKRWAAGKEGNLRALLSTLQYVLWPECGWQPVSLTDLITGAAVKKVYRKATLCIHPDKVQQKGANLQQKYVAEKVFDILKEAWNKFNSEELF